LVVSLTSRPSHPSPSSCTPRWAWDSTKPGSTHFPLASWTATPSGMVMSRPRAAMTPSRTSTVPPSITSPSTGTTRPPVMATELRCRMVMTPCLPPMRRGEVGARRPARGAQMSEQQPPGSGEPTGNAAGKGEKDTRKQGRGKLGGRRTGAPQARERGAQRGSQAGQQPEPATQPLPETATKNGLSWIALAVAVVLGVWQIIYAITMQTMTSDSQEVYTSVWLLISLVLAVA